jgi:hypothetical protein
MRLGDTRQKRGWRELVAESVREGRDPVMHAAWKQRRSYDVSVDEGVIYYALRRAAQHLGHTPSLDQYERAVEELVEAEQRRGRGSILEDTMPSGNQILAWAGPAGWEGAVQLAGLTPRERPKSKSGADPVSLAWHYYETKLELPRSQKALIAYAKELGILLRNYKHWQLADILVELERRRAERGWTTPVAGPLPGERLLEDELAGLIADADSAPERWTLERALDGLVEYLDEFGHDPRGLRYRHYKERAVGRGWPPHSALERLGKKEGIATWAGWLEAARKRQAESRRGVSALSVRRPLHTSSRT